MNQLTNLKSLILIPLTLACLSLAPKVLASGHPVPPSCNTSYGFQALSSLTTGTGDTAFGGETLSSNTDGSENTAIGCGALFSNTTGVHNTAVGVGALSTNTTSSDNTGPSVTKRCLTTQALFFLVARSIQLWVLRRSLETRAEMPTSH